MVREDEGSGADPVAVLREGVRRLGAKFDDQVLQATMALYSPWLRAASGGCEVSRNVAYGDDPRHAVDLYRPAGSDPPVLLFVPGGGFVAGAKNLDENFYANVGTYFAGQGYLTAVMNYRLAPQHPWPAGCDDVARALGWLSREARRFGGDPGRVFAIGQSAGATHLAGVLLGEAFGEEAAGVRAAVLMSGGVYDVKPPLRPGPLAYFGADVASYAQRSPARLARPGHVPLLLTVAEFDPPALARETLLLADRLTEVDGRCPPLLWNEGHNHVSTVFSLGTPQEDVGRALLSFLRSAEGAGPG